MAELFDESHFFICSNGLKPARLKANQGVCLQVSKNHYLTIFSLKCKGVDFSCRWVALLYAIVAAALALLCSCPVGWVLLAAILGAAVGAGLGAMLCGDMAAIMRVWVVIKTDARISTYEIAPNRPGVHLTCSAFGGQITYAPNVKSEFHAWVLFAGNTLLTGLEGFMYVYAARGVGMLVTKPLAFFANFGVNYLKTLTVKGTIGRAIFGVWGGFSAYSNSDREDFHWDEILSEAGKSAAFVETAIYNAVTKGDFHSIVMLLSMGGIPGARESNYRSTKELAYSKTKVVNDIKMLRTELRVEAKATGASYRNLIDLAKEYRARLKEQSNGKGAGEKLTLSSEGKTAKLIAERRQQAIDFYKKHNPNMDILDIESHIAGIDFTKPVKIIKLPAGTELIQYTKINSEGTRLKGDYYTDNPSNTPSELGISETYNVRDPNNGWRHTQEVKEVTQEKTTLSSDVEGMKSTSAPIEDTWSRIDQDGNKLPVKTEGGGSQIYIPKSQF